MKLVKMETGLLDSSTKAAIISVIFQKKKIIAQLSYPTVFRHGEKA